MLYYKFIKIILERVYFNFYLNFVNNIFSIIKKLKKGRTNYQAQCHNSCWASFLDKENFIFFILLYIFFLIFLVVYVGNLLLWNLNSVSKFLWFSCEFNAGKLNRNNDQGIKRICIYKREKKEKWLCNKDPWGLIKSFFFFFIFYFLFFHLIGDPLTSTTTTRRHFIYIFFIFL